LLRQFRANRQRHNTQCWPAYAAQGDQIIEYGFGGVNRDGKAYARALLRAAGEDHGINANDFSARIQKRAAGVAGIDGRIRLNGFVNETAFPADGANGTDDATGHGPAQAKGIADGKNFLSHNQALGVTQDGRRQCASCDLDHRQVILRVCAYDLGAVFLFIAGVDFELPGISDHVIVRQDAAFFIEHKA
jgi:hypothetical protein